MTAGSTQESFMNRIRAALTDRGEPVECPQDLEIARAIPPDADRVAVFITRAAEAGMNPHRVADENGAVEKVAELMQSSGARSAILPDEELPAREAIAQKLNAINVTLIDVDDPDGAFTAEVGITGAARAVAETASLSVISGQGHRRLASLAVPTHIAIIRAEQIVPDLLDWTADYPTDPPASEVLISAPSKTADIEMTLVQGVHGPGVVHVIIIG